MNTNISPEYGADSIRVLRGLEAVRLRPGMYVGDTGKRGLHHLVWEVVDNSVDEAMQNYCTLITVTLAADGETVTVEDNGRGIPTAIHPEEGVSSLEVVLTVLHAGGKFTADVATGGLHGVGVSCVNALSDQLTARVWRDGGAFEQHYSRGVPLAPCERTGDSRKRGTSITWHADPEIFPEGVVLDEEWLVKRFRQTAFLNAGLSIRFINKGTGRDDTYKFDGGIVDFVKSLNEGRTALYPSQPFYFEGNNGKVAIQVALQYSATDDNETVLTYANNINTPDGGTHLSGFKTAVTRIVNQFAKSSNLIKDGTPALSGDDIREGMTAIVSVRIAQPQFEGQTKGKLRSVEAEGAVNTALGEALSEYFEKNPAILKQVAERALLSQRARDAAKKQAELIKRKDVLGSRVVMPDKLTDCESNHKEECELYIVEGDSAAGSSKQGRDPRTQAILPLRGKIINAEKNSLVDLLKNEEVKALITAIGCGVSIGEDDGSFKLEDRRYDKIILMCDADDDGSHITTLLLAFFWNFMPQLVRAGNIYVAQPPLYKVTTGKKITYCWTNGERDQALKVSGGRGQLTRFKGLGEMDAQELCDTTMKVGDRKMLRVTVPDNEDAKRMLSVLMGKSVVERKAHIIAASVRPEWEA